MNKFKKTACFIIILVSLSLFSSCQNEIENIPSEIDLEDGTGILANNNAVDFYFYYPENWTIRRDDTMITIDIHDEEFLASDIIESVSGEPLSYTVRPNISASVFTLLEGYDTVEDYWVNFAAPSYRQAFQDVADESDGEDLTVGGASAKKYTFTYSLSGMEFKISQIIFFNKDRIYALTYTSTEPKYQTYLNVFETVASTFTFK